MNATAPRTANAGNPLTASAQVAPSKLKLSPSFEPCPCEEGEEAFRNDIFEFNITRMMSFIEAHPDRFPRAIVAVASMPNYCEDDRLDQATIATADLSRPVLLAEIAPGRFNLIDGNHRMARARRNGIEALSAHRIHCPHHAPFLTSHMAYQKYVEYWNEKIKDMQPRRRRVSRAPARRTGPKA
jgi:hypothetical protein